MFKLSEQQEERARRLHKESIIVDTLGPTALLGPQYTANMLEAAKELIEERTPLHTIFGKLEHLHAEEIVIGKSDIERGLMESSGVSAMHITSQSLSGPVSGGTPEAFEKAVAGIAIWQMKFDSLDYLVKATNFKHIQEAKHEGKRAIIMGFQNINHLGTDLEKLQWFYDLGIRIMQLTLNHRNYVGNGCLERGDSGLSIFGVELVKRMNELGLIIDVSHCGDQTTMDAIEISKAPVIVSHSFSRKVFNHPRGKTDKQMRALAEHNGFLGVLALPFLIADLSREKASLDDFLNHLDHIVEVMGTDKVGIGTDYTGAPPEPIASKVDEFYGAIGFRKEHGLLSRAVMEGFTDWRQWPNITRGLVSRGYSDDEIKGILGGNFLRVLKEVVG